MPASSTTLADLPDEILQRTIERAAGGYERSGLNCLPVVVRSTLLMAGTNKAFHRAAKGAMGTVEKAYAATGRLKDAFLGRGLTPEAMDRLVRRPASCTIKELRAFCHMDVAGWGSSVPECGHVDVDVVWGRATTKAEWVAKAAATAHVYGPVPRLLSGRLAVWTMKEIDVDVYCTHRDFGTLRAECFQQCAGVDGRFAAALAGLSWSTMIQQRLSPKYFSMNWAELAHALSLKYGSTAAMVAAYEAEQAEMCALGL